MLAEVWGQQRYHVSLSHAFSTSFDHFSQVTRSTMNMPQNSPAILPLTIRRSGGITVNWMTLKMGHIL